MKLLKARRRTEIFRCWKARRLKKLRQERDRLIRGMRWASYKIDEDGESLREYWTSVEEHLTREKDMIEQRLGLKS